MNPTRLLILVASASTLGACASLSSSPSGDSLREQAMIPPTADDESRADRVVVDDPAPPEEAREPAVDPTPAIEAAKAAADRGLDEAGERVTAWWNPLPEQPNWREILAEDRSLPGTLAVGSVSHGHMKNAQRLPLDGQYYSVIERHRRRGTNWGTHEIIRLLRDASAAVAGEFPGSTLRVGNIGYRRGGDIPWSSSHNNGRDADLAFYVKRASDGARVPSPDLVAFNAEGRGREHRDLLFDVPRNWTLVRALLEHPTVDIQWIFLSEPLKQKLLAHARTNGAPEALIERASEVLHQPGDAPPHDDHIHLRITCSKQDRLEGCIDWGPRWEWVDWHKKALLARSLELSKALAASERDVRLKALAFLEKIRSPYAPEVALTHALRESDPEVRQRAAEIAADIPAWSSTALVAARQFIRDTDIPLETRQFAYDILRRSQDRLARRIALSRLLDREVPVEERVHAARALVHTLEPGLLPVFIDELERQPAKVRAVLARVVRRNAVHSVDVDWRAADRRAVQRAVRAWRQWWRAHRDESRSKWLREALARRGIEDVDLNSLGSVERLIPLLREAPDFLAYNTNRHLHHLTDRWVPLEAWSYSKLHRYWARWWGKNRERLLAGHDNDGDDEDG